MFDLNELQNIVLNSKNSFSGEDVIDSLSAKPYSGSWLFVYYEAKGFFFIIITYLFIYL